MAVAFFDYMAALRESDLSGPNRSIALWIASRCSGGWNVSLETIATDSGYSKATVIRAVETLESKGWLIRVKNKAKGNRYDLSLPTDEKCHSDTTVVSESNYMKCHSDTSKGNTSVRERREKCLSDTTVVSESNYMKCHSDTTYIRTIQEHKNNKNLALAYAREDDPTTIKHPDANQGLLWKWVTALVSTSKGKAEVSKTKRYVKADGSIYKDLVISDLMTSEMLFEHFRPWFEQLRAEGRI